MTNNGWIRGFHLTFFYKSVLEAWNILTVSRKPDEHYGTEEHLFFNFLMPTQERVGDSVISAFIGAGMTELGHLLDCENRSWHWRSVPRLD